MQKKKFVPQMIMMLKIVVGAMIYAVGFRYFTYQNNIVSGGLTGIAMMISRFTNFPIGTLVVILNVPLFLLSWRKFGKFFMITSLTAMALCNIAVDALSPFTLEITSELLLASLYGGVVKGIGLGMIYSTGATAGGVDIVAKFLRRRHPHINFGTILLIIDVFVISTYAIIFKSYEIALYAILSSVVYGKVVDFVLYGTVNSKACYIITDKSAEIIPRINERLSRGATLLHAKGAYLGNEKEVILCVLKHQQIVHLRRLIAEMDDCAFVIVCDARQVYGSGFGSIASSE